jgi:nicotinate-nucleotide pyrophosphorylase (carboxylating)
LTLIVEKQPRLPSLDLDEEIVASIKRALDEDIGSGDVTTGAIISPEARATAQIIARQSGVIAGLEIAQTVFLMLDEQAVFKAHAAEGSFVSQGQSVAEVSGSTRALLTGERTALNFIGRMSGIATLTRRFVDEVAGTGALILDTRKTAPGLRRIDKLAVKRGGGSNHRSGLYDMILIKDNHIDSAGSLREAVRRARQQEHNLEVEVEARTFADLQEALDLGIECILLDNMTIDALGEAVALNAGRAQLEASGNILLENVRAVAETGVDFISVGALTHSAPALDVSLELTSAPKVGGLQ